MIDLPAAAGTFVFALVHSGLASRAVKHRISTWCGPGWHRPLFIVVAAACTVVLAWTVFGHPSPMVWQVDGMPAVALRLGQALCLLLALDCARRIGFAHVLGLAALRARFRGEAVRPEEPEAQGPRHGPGGMQATGLFRYSRHPLNLLPIPILWLQPTMTAAMASAFAVATVYFIVGSWHEEVRLRSRFGADYERYRRSGPGFLLPWRR